MGGIPSLRHKPQFSGLSLAPRLVLLPSMAIFLKNLKKTDLEKRLTIPSKSLHCFPPLSDKHTVDFAVKDEESGHVWRFRIYTRKKRNNNILKPVLSKGWREFVCSKQLRVGDRVAFYSAGEQVGAVKYRVKVERPLKIFGASVFPS